jgi:hypothetical protein
MKFIRSHENRLVPVALARIGRGLGFFHPMQQIRLDSFVETRPYRWMLLGLFMYYVILGLAIGGTVILRRRRILCFPIWAVGLISLIIFVTAFGQTRYRTDLEVALALLAAVQLEWIWTRLRLRIRRSSPPDVASEAQDLEQQEPAGSSV